MRILNFNIQAKNPMSRTIPNAINKNNYIPVMKVKLKSFIKKLSNNETWKAIQYIPIASHLPALVLSQGCQSLLCLGGS